MKARIRLETMSDVQKFVGIATQEKAGIFITDGQGLKVSGKSLLGALYALEFDALWVESKANLWQELKDFIVI